MLTQLMLVNSEQEYIIRKQAAIIDELFLLLCQHASLDGIEPILTDIKETSERKERLL